MNFLTKEKGKRWLKAYELWQMVEVARTRANFSVKFRRDEKKLARLQPNLEEGTRIGSAEKPCTPFGLRATLAAGSQWLFQR